MSYLDESEWLNDVFEFCVSCFECKRSVAAGLFMPLDL